MLTKPTFKQRTVSDLNIDIKPPTSNLRVHIIEGRLTINVAKFGSMHPYIKLVYGQDNWRSPCSTSNGMHPKWNNYHHFSTTAESLELILYDSGFIFSDTEIGRCKIHLEDVIRGHATEWWSLLSQKNEVVGAILLSFDVQELNLSSIHSSNSSWDLRTVNFSESSPSVPRLKKMQSSHLSNFTPDHQKFLRFSTEPDEASALERLRLDLVEENKRLRAQEAKVRIIFEKLKSEDLKLGEEKAEVEREVEKMRVKEEEVLEERARLMREKEAIEVDREQLVRAKEGLDLSYLKLKKEKLRLRAVKIMLGKHTGKLVERKKQVDILKGLTGSQG